MSSSTNHQTPNPNHNDGVSPAEEQQEQRQQWEAMARAWLSTLPDGGRTATLSHLEAWLQSNQASLPDEIKSMPPPQLHQRFVSIQNALASSSNNEEKAIVLVDPFHARFQRTDQWMPVYSWLESLQTDEVVKSKDILDWLTENSEVRDQLYSRHSRYHLMHYIKKCHVKILKRKEKKQGVHVTNKATPAKASKVVEIKQPVIVPCNTSSNLTKDSEMYAAKRTEALRKYEILLELEKQLLTLFPKRNNGDNLKES